MLQVQFDDTISRNKLRHLAQAKGASTEILCSNKLCINFFWESFTGFVVLCNAQESIPVTAKQQINWLLDWEIQGKKPHEMDPSYL